MKAKEFIALSLTSALVSVSLVYADSGNVVTMAADLTPQQKETMLKYFDASETTANIISVNNQDERKYLSGVAPDSKIGNKTYSCAFIETAEKGTGVNVSTANLTYVTAGMISSTLITAGVNDVNVVAAAPFPVSGTGALTGCFLAFEDATGDKLDESKKELATEEIIVTGDLGSQYTPEVATGVVNDIKTEVIKNGTKDTTQIADVINNISNNYNIQLTEDNKKDLEELMTKIANEDYDYASVKASLNHVSESVDTQLKEMGIEADTLASGLWYKIKNIFTNAGNNDNLGILEKTNDAALGAGAVIDSTEDHLRPIIDDVKHSSFWDKFTNWIKSLFGNSSEEAPNSESTSEPKITTQDNMESNSSDEYVNRYPESITEDNNTDLNETDTNLNDTETSNSLGN